MDCTYSILVNNLNVSLLGRKSIPGSSAFAELLPGDSFSSLFVASSPVIKFLSRPRLCKAYLPHRHVGILDDGECLGLASCFFLLVPYMLICLLSN